MSNPSVGIVGYGVVGQSLHTLFGDNVVTHDVDSTDEERKRIDNCEVVFVCVPTAANNDGSCDVSIVEDVVGWIRAPLIVIRSTIPPGTTSRLRCQTGKSVIFQPEYIGETVAHPLVDVSKHSFIILGGDLHDCSKVADLYKQYYHSEVRFHFTDSITAELAKYMENAFYAMKVTFCNEFYGIAKAFGISYDELREVWLADPRINRDHTFVYPDNRGFSGKCLPKDTAAIIHTSRCNNYEPMLLEAIMNINAGYRTQDRDYPFHITELHV